MIIDGDTPTEFMQQLSIALYEHAFKHIVDSDPKCVYCLHDASVMNSPQDDNPFTVIGNIPMTLRGPNYTEH